MATNTIVLITGANSGIGKGAAKVITRSSDYHVIMACRDLEKGQEALDEVKSSGINGTVSLVQLDVTSESSIETAAKKIEESFGKLDVLINNAGTGGFETTSLQEKITLLFAVNSTGPALVTEAFKPLLLKSDNARIIFVSSGAGSINRKRDPNYQYKNVQAIAYGMSKAALNMLAAQYHVELLGKAKVYAMSPGFVHTDIRRDKERLPGTIDAETSAETLVDIIDGKRDADIDKFITREGTYPW
jgi:NAD(P)-dependent dehydrogenase (short-subunit alcohol dehydrogenase family)